jgi:4-hydroxybenzoate polyprenyltransferase
VDGRSLLAAVRVIHPFPTLMSVAATGLLAVVAADGRPEPSILIRLLAVMFLTQAAIGTLNDYCDRFADALSKPWKPLVSGAVSARQALGIAVGAATAAVVLGATLGPAAWLYGVLGLAAGITYDLRLKRTVLSGVPYLVALPLVPLWVWEASGAFSPALWWLVPLGGLLGAALHLANALPDLNEDAEAGIQNAAHALGDAWTVRLACASFLLAQGLAAAVLVLLDGDLRLYLPGAVPSLLLLLLGAWALYGRLRLDRRWGFGAWMASALLVSVSWLAALT